MEAAEGLKKGHAWCFQQNLSGDGMEEGETEAMDQEPVGSGHVWPHIG